MDLIKKYALEGERIYSERTAGDLTWEGLFAAFYLELRDQQTRNISNLLSDEGENEEYDRSCCGGT